jgi:hypothetical protein
MEDGIPCSSGAQCFQGACVRNLGSFNGALSGTWDLNTPFGECSKICTPVGEGAGTQTRVNVCIDQDTVRLAANK